MTKNPMKVITGKDTRWSYANVWEPKSINGGVPKYSVSLIIPKSDTKTIEAIKKAIQAAYKEGEAKLKGNSRSVPPLEAIKTPLRDGDLERPDDEAYKNSYFVNANSTTPPGIVDASVCLLYTSLLRDIVDDMHALANSLSTLASALESDKPAKTELSLSDVRAVLAKKSQAGFTREIKVLIEKYGAEKLSAVEPKHYERCV